jgi:hypothetical protein
MPIVFLRRDLPPRRPQRYIPEIAGDIYAANAHDSRRGEIDGIVVKKAETGLDVPCVVVSFLVVGRDDWNLNSKAISF